MSQTRKICVVTGSRAEYGLLRWVMEDLADRAGVRLQVVACAMHLVPELGHTVDHIRADGFAVDAEVPMLAPGDTPGAMGRSIGLGVGGLTDAFEDLEPDLVVVLGDRLEILAAAAAATALQIPIAHIHGGETSEGAIDEAFRHAVTKMAHLHFAATPAYGRRIVQMGEAPDRVFVVGAPGLDNFLRLDLPDRSSLGAQLGLDLSGTVILVTYHPVTVGGGDPVASLDQVLAALDRVDDAAVIATKANADAGGAAINRRLEAYAASRQGRVALSASLGQAGYLGALKSADVVVGNSSSGIIEAPAAGTPTVNVGPRQQGRLRASSVIDCPEDADAIAAAIEHALDPAFMAACADAVPPYGTAQNASAKIVDVLCSHDLNGITVKTFYDMEGT